MDFQRLEEVQIKKNHLESRNNSKQLKCNWIKNAKQPARNSSKFMINAVAEQSAFQRLNSCLNWNVVTLLESKLIF